MQVLLIGVQDFVKIREQNYLYVDVKLSKLNRDRANYS